MEKGRHVVLRYCNPDGRTDCGFPHNPNGSVESIAGICDRTGRVFGLMPHPEAYLSPYNAPDWTRSGPGELPSEGLGMPIFRNAVEYAAENL